jgi:N-acetyl-1-D-myo-inositol-2-amino-2-deoxy-alpha-D-glucopyranoside deacetylase
VPGDDREVPTAASRRDVALGVPVALLGGLVVGTIGTFKHQVGVSAATGAGWPIGLVLSLAMVLLFLLALRLALPSRWFAAAAAAGVVGAVALLSLPGSSGGSTVILLNTVGIVWTVAQAVLAVAVVGWPRRRARTAPAPGGILEGDPAEKDD